MSYYVRSSTLQQEEHSCKILYVSTYNSQPSTLVKHEDGIHMTSHKASFKHISPWYLTQLSCQ